MQMFIHLNLQLSFIIKFCYINFLLFYLRKIPEVQVKNLFVLILFD